MTLECPSCHEEKATDYAERDDRFGAMARYFLAVARGEQPDDYDAELAGLPKIGVKTPQRVDEWHLGISTPRSSGGVPA